jgi:hypothetical protein
MMPLAGADSPRVRVKKNNRQTSQNRTEQEFAAVRKAKLFSIKYCWLSRIADQITDY